MFINEMPPQSILVVDDEPDMRLALTQSLSHGGYSVDCASSGFEALEKFNKDKYGLVITDMKMPKMSGMEVLGEIKKQSPQVPVIMITAYGTIDHAVEAMQAGAADYIIKPFSAEALDAAVKKACIKSNGKVKGQTIARPAKRGPYQKRIITRDPKMLSILSMAKNVAPSNATVIILGESGTGKEMLASYIHQHGFQSDRPYVAVNCAALPESLAESELFGHEKGAFTGAASRKMGKFELANHGTIILDEISEMPLPLQAKLLRVLQEREVDRVGGNKAVPIDVRVIAISNIDLKKAVKERKFREDLYYRVNVIPLTIPPLRERKADIAPLANYFLESYAATNNKMMRKIPDESISLLSEHEWKGNIRELENTIERAVLIGEGEALLPKYIFFESTGEESKKSVPVRVGMSVRDMERELIFQTLDKVNGNRTHASQMLGISIRTLRNKLSEYKQEN